jgi:hypothetical protein
MVLTPVSHADMSNQLTKLTFSQPVLIPGHKVLTAGTYWFRLLDGGAAGRNVVLIYNNNHQLDATLLSRDTYRSTPTGNTVLMLSKTSRGTPTVALMKWFYPGEQFGQAIVYPTRTLRQLRESGTMNVTAWPADEVAWAG